MLNGKTLNQRIKFMSNVHTTLPQQLDSLCSLRCNMQVNPSSLECRIHCWSPCSISLASTAHCQSSFIS